MINVGKNYNQPQNGIVLQNVVENKEMDSVIIQIVIKHTIVEKSGTNKNQEPTK